MKVIGLTPDSFQPVNNFERVEFKKSKGVSPVIGVEGEAVKNGDHHSFQTEPSHYVIDLLQKKRERQKKKDYTNHHKLSNGRRAYKAEPPKMNQKGTKLNREV